MATLSSTRRPRVKVVDEKISEKSRSLEKSSAEKMRLFLNENFINYFHS